MGKFSSAAPNHGTQAQGKIQQGRGGQPEETPQEAFNKIEKVHPPHSEDDLSRRSKRRDLMMMRDGDDASSSNLVFGY